MVNRHVPVFFECIMKRIILSLIDQNAFCVRWIE